jgi:hypothetical protein
MVVLHRNDRTYGNAYLITFKAGTLHAHTHILSTSILPTLEAPAEGFFQNPPQFGRRIRFDSLHGCEKFPHEAHFQNRQQPKVTRSEIMRVRWSGDDRMSFSARTCCAKRDVWLGALS